MSIAKLDRTILRLTGDEVAPWLEGLITNTFSGELTFAALLTPQGKIIADFFIWQDAAAPNDGIYIDTPVKFGEALFKRLKMYRLRAPITIDDVSENVSIYVLWDDARGVADPRHGGVRRLKSEIALETDATQDDWDMHRLSLGLPDSQWDFASAETFPHNVNMDHLNGVNFKKGCFIGQEVVSRMQRKTVIRKRFCAVTYSGDLEGSEIKAGERVVGEIVHARGGWAMTLMRLDRLEGNELPLQAGPAVVELAQPVNA